MPADEAIVLAGGFGTRLRGIVDDVPKPLAPVAGRPFLTVEQAVHRLTGELADWYGIDAGHLRLGDRADLMVLDPDRLDDSLEAYAESPVEQYGGLSRMVNRNDATVPLVMVGGRTVFRAGVPSEPVGRERTGRFLRAGEQSREPLRRTSPSTELAS